MATLLEALKEKEQTILAQEEEIQTLKQKLSKAKQTSEPQVVVQEKVVEKEVKVPVVDAKYQNLYYQALDDKSKASEKIEALTKRLHQKNSELCMMIRQHAQTEKELRDKIEELTKQLGDKKPKLVVVEWPIEFHSTLRDALDQNDCFRKENETLWELNHKLEADIKSLQQEIQSLEAQLEALKKEDRASTIAMAESIAFEYEEENKRLREEVEQLKLDNQQLRAKAISSEITFNSYRDKNKKAKVLIVEGTEPDYYPGEQKDLIIEYLRDKLANLDPYTRQYHIVKSILEANPETGRRAELRTGIFNAFKGFTGSSAMNKVFNTKLRELGFEIIRGKTHDKLLFHNDERYSISIPCTPKTGNHDRLNQAADTVRIVL